MEIYQKHMASLLPPDKIYQRDTYNIKPDTKKAFSFRGINTSVNHTLYWIDISGKPAVHKVRVLALDRISDYKEKSYGSMRGIIGKDDDAAIVVDLPHGATRVRVTGIHNLYNNRVHAEWLINEVSVGDAEWFDNLECQKPDTTMKIVKPRIKHSMCVLLFLMSGKLWGVGNKIV